ncbi:hypothetical protein BDZ89DRAFT_1065639 [Hymenopellis radicata]|nr:hypothetical protein BDZ89DRAFT_1065639 [Hymenopellis radicata]
MDFTVQDRLPHPFSDHPDAQAIHGLLQLNQPVLMDRRASRNFAAQFASIPDPMFPPPPQHWHHRQPHEPVIAPLRRRSYGAPEFSAVASHHHPFHFHPPPMFMGVPLFGDPAPTAAPQVEIQPMTSPHRRQQLARMNLMHGLRQMRHTRRQQPPPTEPQPENAQKTCSVCLDTIQENPICAPCSHSFDAACIESLVSAALKDESMFPPKCCGKAIPLELVESHIDGSVVSLYKEKSVEYSTVLRVYCSKKTCSRFLGARNNDSSSSPVALPCTDECGQSTCNTCLNKVEDGNISIHVCTQNESDEQIHQLADSKQWATCPGCRTLVELSMGCNHVLCRCGTQFCYVCSGKWGACRCALAPRRASTMVQRRSMLRRRSHPYRSRREEETAPVLDYHPPDFFSSDDAIEAAIRHELQQTYLAHRRGEEVERQRMARTFAPAPGPGPSRFTDAGFGRAFDPIIDPLHLPSPGNEWTMPHFDLLPDQNVFGHSYQPSQQHETVYNAPIDLSQFMDVPSPVVPQDERFHSPASPPPPYSAGRFMW